MDKKFREYLSKWVSGLNEEIAYWDDYMKYEGGISFYGFQKTVSPERKFELEEDIPIEMYGKEYKFIDVGSGPFSRCGKVTEKVMLKTITVDPLAYAYTELKNRYRLNNEVNLESGFVELLDMKFRANSFDMVHMSNSLDHCFSAIDGIYQLLNICKIGGKVILRHAENEAENGNYGGLHQWNLSLHNEEDSFIIWRKEERYDICKLFREYADIELFPDQKEKNGHWIYNKVVLKKRKNIELPENPYYMDILNIIYRQLIYELVKDKQITEIVKPREFNTAEKRIAKIRKNWHEKEQFKEKLGKKGWHTFIIYGMGYVGNNLDYLLMECGIQSVKIDKLGSNSKCFQAITLEECENFDVDRIIITIDNQEVYKLLQKKAGKKENVIGIDEFLEILEETE